MKENQDKGEIGLEAAYALEGPDDNRRLYAAWADTYEESFVAVHRYIYHRGVARVFSEGFGTRRGVVLDVGCGTGIVGAELRRLGIMHIDGIDISPEMLTEATTKTYEAEPVYRNLIEADLTEPIEAAAGQYAGIVSAGTFTHGHLGPEPLAELVRVAASGAFCAIGINSAHFAELGFQACLDELASAGAIDPYELVDTLIYAGVPGDDADDVGHVAVFTVV
ncbi:MAG: class I SAM-dependent methyltransferase [bacterium]|nr:class I SAM-dependent methyltransferase [bacterium]